LSRRRRRPPSVPGFRARRPVVQPWPDVYIAPRIGEVSAKGRTTRQAQCGHAVFISRRGLDAIGRRGKRLICDRCAVALASEQGGILGVVYPIDDAGDARAKED
jgi:hypothetical protein